MASRLTPTERLVNAGLRRLLGHRAMVARHGKKHHGLKVEETVDLAWVRLSKTLGTVITAISLFDALLISVRTARYALQKLARKGLITVTKKKVGNEVVYENPEGYTYPKVLIDDMVELIADQINLGPELMALVNRLDDQDLKARILKKIRTANDANKLSASRLI